MAHLDDRLPAVLAAPDAEQQLIAASVLKLKEKPKLKVIRKLLCVWQKVREQARTEVALLDMGCTMGQIGRIRTRFVQALAQV